MPLMGLLSCWFGARGSVWGLLLEVLVLVLFRAEEWEVNELKKEDLRVAVETCLGMLPIYIGFKIINGDIWENDIPRGID